MTTQKLPHLFRLDGAWTQLDHDPVLDAPGVARGESKDFDTQTEQAGYSSFLSFPASDLAFLRLEVWRANQVASERGEPEFQIDISTQVGWDVVYAENTPALMDLLSRWAPAVQGSALSDFLTGLEDPKGAHSSLGKLLQEALKQQR